MQTSNHQAKQHPESPSRWILFVEGIGMGDAAGVRGAQSSDDAPASPDRQLMDGRQLENAFAPYLDHLEIVISDWRALHAPLDGFRQRLPAAMAKRVVDSVFLPELTNSSWSDYHSALATRYACIRLWLDQQRPHAGDRWIALEQDSQLDAWPKDERERVVIGSLAHPQVLRRLLDLLQACLGRTGA